MASHHLANRLKVLGAWQHVASRRKALVEQVLAIMLQPEPRGRHGRRAAVIRLVIEEGGDLELRRRGAIRPAVGAADVHT